MGLLKFNRNQTKENDGKFPPALPGPRVAASDANGSLRSDLDRVRQATISLGIWSVLGCGHVGLGRGDDVYRSRCTAQADCKY
jgi:hypothetical protein